MYDTVRLWIDAKYTGRIMAEQLFANTSHPERIIKQDEKTTREYYKAFLPYPQHSKTGQGWDIWLFSTGIKIQGSPAKWLFGNNAETLTLTQAEKTFKTLAEALQLPFESLLWGRVQRLDFSTVICMEHAPKAYYGNLDYLHKYRRSLDASGDSLYFKQTEKWVLFYDKVKDAQAKGMTLPDWAKGQNLLRYEVRYYNPRRTHLFAVKEQWIGDGDGEGNLYLRDILNEKIYTACVDAWLHIYENINKSSKISDMITTQRLNKPKELTLAIVAPIMKEIGLDTLKEMLEQAVLKNPHLTTKQKSTSWSQIKSITDSAENEYTDAAQELNIKVRQRAKAIKDRMYDA